MRHVSDAERRRRIATRHALSPEHRLDGVEAVTRAMTVLHATEAATVHLAVRDGLQALHPGGNIGLRLKPVSTLMHPAPGLPVVGPETPMATVLVTMTTASFGVAGIVDADGRLLGIITDGIVRILEARALRYQVAR